MTPTHVYNADVKAEAEESISILQTWNLERHIDNAMVSARKRTVTGLRRLPGGT